MFSGLLIDIILLSWYFRTVLYVCSSFFPHGMSKDGNEPSGGFSKGVFDINPIILIKLEFNKT